MTSGCSDRHQLGRKIHPSCQYPQKHVLVEFLIKICYILEKSIIKLKEFNITFFGYPMFFAQFLPKLKTYLVSALPQLEHDHLTRHDARVMNFSARELICYHSLVDIPILTESEK